MQIADNVRVTLDTELVAEPLWVQTVRRVRLLNLRSQAGELLVIPILIPLLLTVALWNGFPIIFYDTGAYVLEGLGHVFVAERDPVYSLLLRYSDAAGNLWNIAVIQAALTAFVVVEFARAESPEMPIWELVLLVAVVCALTGLGWYVGQVEPDCMTALVVLSLYLLAFRTTCLGPLRTLLLVVVAGLAISTHPAHLALAGGLFACIGLLILFRPKAVSPPHLLWPAAGLVLGIILVIAANYELTERYFISRSGPVFAFARMLQDGLIKPELDKTCPESHFVLCAYERDLPDRADAFLWDANSPFNKLRRFNGPVEEYRTIALGSLWDFPLANLGAALKDTASQFIRIRTGDQIEPQEWILYSDLAHYLPRQMNAYMSARQQQGKLQFGVLNAIHVATASASLFWLLMLFASATRKEQGPRMALLGFVLLALVGNAFVCGVFSNPHDRYQSRLIWVPTLVCLVLALPRILAELGRILHLEKYV